MYFVRSIYSQKVLGINSWLGIFLCVWPWDECSSQSKAPFEFPKAVMTSFRIWLSIRLYIYLGIAAKEVFRHVKAMQYGCPQDALTTHHKGRESWGKVSLQSRLPSHREQKENRPWKRSQFCVWQPSYLPLSPTDNSIAAAAKGAMKVPTKNG